MTTRTQIFTISVNNVQSIKVENFSYQASTFNTIIYLGMVANAATTAINLASNSFINPAGVIVPYTYIQRGNLKEKEIILNNRPSHDVEIDNTYTDILNITVTISDEANAVPNNLNTSNPLCFELIVTSWY